MSRWMAHYIAEQITLAETASGSDKAAAKERCFQTILSLWEHRAALPHGRRPFEGFEPILRALASLDPEGRRPYYHQITRPDKVPGKGEPDPAQVLVDFMLGVDSAARIVIQAAVDEAVEMATSEQTLLMLINAIPTSSVCDIEIINSLIERGKVLRPELDDEKAVARKILQTRLEKLDAFCALCTEVRKTFEKQFKRI